MTKKIILWILVIFWMGLIFWFSSFNGIDSTRQSRGFLHDTLGKIIDVIKPSMSEYDKEILIEKLDTPVRKMAHASVFFILAVFVCLLVKTYNVNRLYLISFIVCFLYAISDEVHQIFVSERSAQVLDVFIDSSGSLLALLFMNFINNRKK